jgi:small subunit ribosomal protein S1
MTNTVDNFDWDLVTDKKGFGGNYSAKEREQLEKLYEGTLNQVEEKKVLTGVIVGITDREVIVNIGFKSDGLISLSEFRDQGEELVVGLEVEVFIEDQEDKNGQLILSRKKAKIVKAWDNIQGALEKDLVIDGFVKRRTKGGLIVDIYFI